MINQYFCNHLRHKNYNSDNLQADIRRFPQGTHRFFLWNDVPGTACLCHAAAWRRFLVSRRGLRSGCRFEHLQPAPPALHTFCNGRFFFTPAQGTRHWASCAKDTHAATTLATKVKRKPTSCVTSSSRIHSHYYITLSTHCPNNIANFSTWVLSKDWKNAQVASLLGMAEITIKKRKARLISLLREKLGDELGGILLPLLTI